MLPAMDSLDWKDSEVFNDTDEIIGYVYTEYKIDYVFNINKELVATIQNNEYRLAEELNKLDKERKCLKKHQD